MKENDPQPVDPSGPGPIGRPVSEGVHHEAGDSEHNHGGHDHADHAGHDHDDHAGHDHDDHAGHDHDFRDAPRRSLIITLTLISGFMVVEVIGGILSGSLALIADAGHMITDAAAIALALLAILVAARPSSAERTFGYQRTEVLAAFVNAMSLWLIAAWVLLEAYHRLQDVPDVEGRLMLVVGVIGLGVNVVAAMVLHGSSGHSLNVEGAFRHVMADLMGSVAVVISAIVITTLGWSIIDPILSIVIAVLIVASSWRLVFKVINVLLEGVPEHIDVFRLCSELEEEEGVTLVHDVHVWSISSGYDSFTAHVLVDPSYQGNTDALLSRMRDIAKRDFNIDHFTIQLERSAAGCTENHHVDHLRSRVRTLKKRRFILPFS